MAIGVLATSACTAVGLSPPAAASAIRCALSNFKEYDRATDQLGDPAIVAAPPGVAETASLGDAICHMALAALSQITDGERLGVFLALPEARPGLPDDLAAKVTAFLMDHIPSVRVAPAGAEGHAAGGVALRQAIDLLSGDNPLPIAVLGVDSYLHPETIAWLDKSRQLHAPYNAWGFIPGAAAGACLLDRVNRQGRRQEFHAIVERVALDQEEVPIKSDGVCLGWAMSRVIQDLIEGQAEDALLDALYCDQNGEAYRADEMGFMLARVGERFRDPASFVAPADCWGDVGAASIPLFIGLAIEAARGGYAPGPVSIHIAGSESGVRTGLRLRTAARNN